jgi:outer membrane protein OmpA-like peptidoglycan-associated protein
MRTGLLTALILPILAAPSLVAQVAPTLTGETGLFTMPNAEMLPQGQFSFGLAYNLQALPSAPSLAYPPGVDDPLRYSTSKVGMTLGYGLLPNWEGSLSFGQRYYSAETRAWSGIINGFDRTGGITHDETDKVRIGTKLLFNPNTDLVKLVLSAGMWIPTQSKNDAAALSTNRTDWDFGASFNYKVLTVGIGWLLPAPRDTFRLANQLTFGVGVGLPFGEIFRAIGEVNRVHFDGGDSKPSDYSEVALGGRLALGKSGFTASAAVRANIDQWTKYGTSSPSPFGGLVQLAFMPQPARAPTERVPVRAPEPEPVPAAPAAGSAPAAGDAGQAAPAPAAAAAPPAPRPETSTTDEILFDAAKNRLTNIAKAILDGVALRLKNNLSATCTVTGYADPKEKGGDHAKLGLARADAAKDYLVKRHGIDASRIKTESSGDAGAVADATRNRRAVVSVTFP